MMYVLELTYKCIWKERQNRLHLNLASAFLLQHSQETITEQNKQKYKTFKHITMSLLTVITKNVLANVLYITTLFVDLTNLCIRM